MHRISANQSKLLVPMSLKLESGSVPEEKQENNKHVFQSTVLFF